MIDRNINNWQLTLNFNLREFQSPDTEEVKISIKLVEKIQQLRDLVKNPIIVISGYRTESHNRDVAGASNSKHMKGYAADLICSALPFSQFYEDAKLIGFYKIIPYYERKFIHVETKDETF